MRLTAPRRSCLSLAAALLLVAPGCTSPSPTTPAPSAAPAVPPKDVDGYLLDGITQLSNAVGSTKVTHLHLSFGASNGSWPAVTATFVKDDGLVAKRFFEGQVQDEKAPTTMPASTAVAELETVRPLAHIVWARNWIGAHCPNSKQDLNYLGTVQVDVLPTGLLTSRAECGSAKDAQLPGVRLGDTELPAPTLQDPAADVNQALAILERFKVTNVDYLAIDRTAAGPEPQRVTFSAHILTPNGAKTVAGKPCLLWFRWSATELALDCQPMPEAAPRPMPLDLIYPEAASTILEDVPAESKLLLMIIRDAKGPVWHQTEPKVADYNLSGYAI